MSSEPLDTPLGELTTWKVEAHLSEALQEIQRNWRARWVKTGPGNVEGLVVNPQTWHRRHLEQVNAWEVPIEAWDKTPREVAKMYAVYLAQRTLREG